MESRLPKAMAVSLLVLLMLTVGLAVPVQAPPLGPPASEVVWVTINATAQGNYPGGNELFVVFAVNSAQQRTLNESIDDMTLTAPLGSTCCSNFAPGLPTILTPGQSIAATIYLQIPSNFTQPNFTANLVAHVTLLNGTVHTPVTLTGTAPVNVFSLTSQSQSTSQTTAGSASQTGTISTPLFAAGVGIPSIIAIILVVLLVQARGASKRMGP